MARLKPTIGELVLRLYVAGSAPNSLRAIANTKAICDEHFASGYELEIVDMLEHPQRALVRVPTQMAVTELEDQIATMDDQLNAERLSQSPAPQLALLQHDRAQLVESLAQVRYAQNLVAGLP